MDLTRQSNEELISNTHGAIKNETEATINVVRHFKEIYERDLYLARGFSTMYLMAVEEFGYDSSSALRRTHALELALAVPSVLEKIDRGELCLQSVADIQTFLNRERGAKKIYSPEQKAELVNNCSGLSTRSVQAELAGRNSDVSFCETKKVISKNQIRVTYVTKIATEEKLDRIKSLRSHVNPYMSRDELLNFMAEKTLDQIDPLRKIDRVERRVAKKSLTVLPAQAVEVGLQIREEIVNEVGEIQLAIDFEDERFHEADKRAESRGDRAIELRRRKGPELSTDGGLEKMRSRYVSARSDRIVRKVNQGVGCGYVDRETGRRCSSKYQEQRDHILEFSKDGSNEPENLQIFCGKHNRYRWRSRNGSAC